MPCVTVVPRTSISRSRFAAKGFCLLFKTTAAESENKGSELCGLGVKSMASRAEWLGGELSLLPSSPQGTRVQVIVPMDC